MLPTRSRLPSPTLRALPNLHGGLLKLEKAKGKPAAIVVARKAILTIINQADGSGADITMHLEDGTAFDPTTFKKVSGSVDELNQAGRPIPLPSTLKSKPKFLNVGELINYKIDPYLFRPVKEVIDKIEDKYDYQVVSQRLFDDWGDHNAASEPMTFYTAATEGSGKDRVRAHVPKGHPR